MSFDCPFESEIREAVLLDAELRTHAAQCRICSDVLAIAGAFDQARDETRACAVIPDAGRIWMLAQIRARGEAVKAAERPISAAQLLAFACAIALLTAWFQPAVELITPLVMEHSVLALSMAALVFVIPTAVYVALGRD
jgi:hypothetical protein